MRAIGARTGRLSSREWLPLPVPDFGQISTVLVNVLLVSDQHVLELRFQVDALLAVAGMAYGGPLGDEIAVLRLDQTNSLGQLPSRAHDRFKIKGKVGDGTCHLHARPACGLRLFF